MNKIPSRSDADDLLPPGAADRRAAPPGHSQPPGPLSQRDLLPPGFAKPPLPVVASPERPPVQGPAPPQLVSIPAAEPAPAPAQPPLDGAVRYESTRRLSAAERAQRRLVKNLILGGLCILILLIVGYWLAR